MSVHQHVRELQAENKKLKDRMERYAYWIYCMIADGDGNPSDMTDMMHEDGFLNENDEWDYGDEG